MQLRRVAMLALGFRHRDTTKQHFIAAPVMDLRMLPGLHALPRPPDFADLAARAQHGGPDLGYRDVVGCERGG